MPTAVGAAAGVRLEREAGRADRGAGVSGPKLTAARAASCDAEPSWRLNTSFSRRTTVSCASSCAIACACRQHQALGQETEGKRTSAVSPAMRARPGDGIVCDDRPTDTSRAGAARPRGDGACRASSVAAAAATVPGGSGACRSGRTSPSSAKRAAGRGAAGEGVLAGAWTGCAGAGDGMRCVRSVWTSARSRASCTASDQKRKGTERAHLGLRGLVFLARVRRFLAELLSPPTISPSPPPSSLTSSYLRRDAGSIGRRRPQRL
jgi:hypothetical protein